ncbi:MAG: riboflavin synthase [Dehalococcoidia bacterium]
MFTGIIEETGEVISAGHDGMLISARTVLEGTKAGDSISVNGACLTVIDIGKDAFSVEIMPETLRRTSLARLKPRGKVNLERSLASGGRFGGHFVQGHVDGTGTVLSMAPEGKAIVMKVEAPPAIMRYLVEKGFIALEGASLTITSCDLNSFSVSLVTYTMEHTTLGSKKPGEPVNLEIDVLAKYVERLVNPGKSGITAEFLADHGFV